MKTENNLLNVSFSVDSLKKTIERPYFLTTKPYDLCGLLVEEILVVWLNDKDLLH